MPSLELYSVCTLTGQRGERVLVSLHFVSVCAGIFVRGHACICICEHREARGRLWCRSSGGDDLDFEDRVFPGLELDKSSRLAGQQAPEIYLSLPPTL